NKCNAVLAYNSAGYFVHHRVDALAASNGTQMKFAPSLTLNYPPSGGTASDVLVTTASLTSSVFNDNNFPVVRIASSRTPTTTGILTLAQALGGGTHTSGDAGLTMVPVGSMLACVRVPMAVSATVVVTSSGATMPSNNYTGFSGQLAGAGFTGTITDAE